jgi:hypothetical protein
VRRSVVAATVGDVAQPRALDPGLRAVLDRQVLVLLELSDEVLKDVTLTECLRQFHP